MLRLLRNKRSESGAADIMTTLIMLPIAFFLILTLIEMSFYFSTRSLVQNVIQDATRQASSWGGNSTRLNTLGVPVNQAAHTSITESNSTSARVKDLNVQCAVNGNPYGTAKKPGDEIECTATYNYSGVTGGAANFFGFGFIGDTVEVNGVSRSSVGFGG